LYVFRLELSIFILILITLISRFSLILLTLLNCTSKSLSFFRKILFPLGELTSKHFRGLFILLATLNLISLVRFSYPVTTTLGFNLRAALSLWFTRIIFLLNKSFSFSVFLPINSPWYLVPFLRVVELVRILVRPITLCFRLLANIRAGHILLALICKISNSLWLLGVLFGLLELIVAIVQSFVFLILIRVYLEEGFRH